MSKPDFDVAHLAELARMDLTDAEQSRLEKEIGSILGYVNQLQEVNVDGVEETAQVTGLTNVLRPDEPSNLSVAERTALRDSYLAAAPETQDGLIKIPAIFGE